MDQLHQGSFNLTIFEVYLVDLQPCLSQLLQERLLLIAMRLLNILLVRFHLSLLLHWLFLDLLLHSRRLLRHCCWINNQKALIIDFAHIFREQLSNIIPILKIGETFVIVEGGKFMQTVFLKKRSNELDMLTVF